jgi:hypothetical protein
LNKEKNEGDLEFRMIRPPPYEVERNSHEDKQTDPHWTEYPIGRGEERLI